jgi:hypothetical protein
MRDWLDEKDADWNDSCGSGRATTWLFAAAPFPER